MTKPSHTKKKKTNEEMLTTYSTLLFDIRRMWRKNILCLIDNSDEKHLK